MTLRGLVAEPAEQGVKVSYRTVWNFVHREKISYKKSVFSTEQNRPGVARHRARWKRYQDKIDPKRLVFIDETWVKTNMAPLRGWCARGKRLVARVPYGHWKKHLMRKAGERTIDATWNRLGTSLDHFSPQECASYFRNAGYAS